jgi:hypothetical protein
MQRTAEKINHAYPVVSGRRGGTVVFDFRLGRGRDGPGSFWNGSKAFRRQFFEAVQLNPKDPIATLIVARTVNGLLTLNLWL